MFWQFVKDNIKADPRDLRLKYHGKEAPFDMALAITQIECRQRFGKKLAQTLARAPRFLFPSVLAGEQATSDALASYHASLVGEATSIADLTAGLGIDAWHLAVSHPSAAMVAMELDEERARALEANVAQLDVPNLRVERGDCSQRLPQADVYFIDPARRAHDGSRVFSLSDCQPDVLALAPRLRGRLIVKASPMLDVSLASSQLIEAGARVSRAIAVGTPTECRELVFVCEPAGFTEARISAVTISDETVLTYDFTAAAESRAVALPPLTARDIKAGDSLMVPYPSVMKAAPFRLISQQTGARPIAPNTHLYVAGAPVDTPLGTWLTIVDVVPYESRYIKRLRRTYPEAQVATRNFHISAQALRSQLGVRDTGRLRLFGVTCGDGRPLMIIAK